MIENKTSNICIVKLILPNCPNKPDKVELRRCLKVLFACHTIEHEPGGCDGFEPTHSATPNGPSIQRNREGVSSERGQRCI